MKGLGVDRERVDSLVEAEPDDGHRPRAKIGYDAAAKLAKEAYETRRNIPDLAAEKKLLSPEELQKTLDLRHQTEAGRGRLARRG